jgi:hypothetical protein
MKISISLLILISFCTISYGQNEEIEAQLSVASYEVSKLAKLAGYKDIQSNYYYHNGVLKRGNLLNTYNESPAAYYQCDAPTYINLVKWVTLKGFHITIDNYNSAHIIIEDNDGIILVYSEDNLIEEVLKHTIKYMLHRS